MHHPTYTIPKIFFSKLGPIQAAILANLMDADHSLLTPQQNRQNDSWFFLEKKEQCKTLNISKHVHKVNLAALRDSGFVNFERKGIPPKYYYSINYEKILEIVCKSS